MTKTKLIPRNPEEIQERRKRIEQILNEFQTIWKQVMLVEFSGMNIGFLDQLKVRRYLQKVLWSMSTPELYRWSRNETASVITEIVRRNLIAELEKKRNITG